MVLFRDCIPYSHIHVLSVLSEVLFYLAAQWLCFVITSLLVHLLSVPSEVSFHLAAGRAVAVICLSRFLISFYPLRSIGGIFFIQHCSISVAFIHVLSGRGIIPSIT